MAWTHKCRRAVADPETVKSGTMYHLSQMHTTNYNYAFYTGKGGFFKNF